MPRVAPDRFAIPIPQYDHGWLLDFLRPRVIRGVETIVDDAYVRTMRVEGKLHAVTIARAPAGIRVTVAPPASRAALRRALRAMLSADADITAFRARAAEDPILRPLVVARPAVRLIRFADPFEGFVRAILGQQVSLAAAATAAGRLVEALGHRTVSSNGLQLRAFPTARAIALTSEATLRSIGLTRAKAVALRENARAIVSGRLDLAALARTSAARADDALRALPGVGPWTAAYVRMRALGDADAFPASDLGVLKALRRITGQLDLDAEDAARLAERWRPWRAYATLHLWASA